MTLFRKIYTIPESQQSLANAISRINACVNLYEKNFGANAANEIKNVINPEIEKIKTAFLSLHNFLTEQSEEAYFDAASKNRINSEIFRQLIEPGFLNNNTLKTIKDAFPVDALNGGLQKEVKDFIDEISRNYMQGYAHAHGYVKDIDLAPMQQTVTVR